MTLNNIKTMRKDRGFTIVELLIVIVVIGILAAIVIVAYQGVTQKANASKAQTNAVTVQKKAEAYAADTDTTNGGNGAYPATATAFAALPSTALGGVPSGITVSKDAPTMAAKNTTTSVQYVSCTVSSAVTGYYIGYYDQSQKSMIYLTGGSAKNSDATGKTAPTTTDCPGASTT